MTPRLLDLFCGAGGAAKGYADAGFEVVGVDIEPQPHYPFAFVQGDALSPPVRFEDFDAIHASPPCQAYSTVSGRAKKGRRDSYPDLIDPTRVMLRLVGLPYIIENVPPAPLRDAVQLCGSSFGLDVRRHRRFESNIPLWSTPCHHGWQRPRFRSLDSRQKVMASVIGVHGHLNYAGERELREQAMGIGWMTPVELSEAIPPAYTEYLGAALLESLSLTSPGGRE